MTLCYTTVETRLGTASLRDLTPADIDAVVAYWHEGGADLDFLGIDRNRLVTPASTRERFERGVRTGDPAQRNLAFTIDLKGVLAGYTLLTQHSSDANNSHS